MLRIVLLTLFIYTSYVGITQAQEKAKGVTVYDPRKGTATRVGVFCKMMSTDSDERYYEGLCNISRQGDVTIVDTGSIKYKITRDDFEPTQAMLYDMTNNTRLGYVEAKGSCWVGKTIKYCAK